MTSNIDKPTAPPTEQGTVQGDIPWPALMTLVIGAFMAILDGSIINVALPKLMSIFSVSADSIQWVMTSYLLVSGMVIPITGYLCDRFGSKNMYIFSLAIFTVGSAMCALSWSNNTLVAARVVQAIGGGMIMPVTMGMIYSIVPLQKIGLAMGVWGISAMVAPTLGPTLGGYLVDNVGWEWIFTINIPIGIASIVLTMLVLEESPRRSNLKPDIFGTVMIAVASLALLLALSEGQNKGWNSLFIVNLFITSTFCFVIYIIWELNSPDPVLDLRLLKNKTFSVSLVSLSIVSIGMFSMLFLVPIYAQNVLGLSPMKTGLLIMPAAIVTGIAMPISGKLFDKFGARPVCLVGLAITTITTYQLHTLSSDTSFTQLQWLLVKRSFGMGLAMMPLSTAGMYTVPPFLTARASALNNLIRQIAASLGIAYFTHIMLQRQEYHAGRMVEAISCTSPTAFGFLNKIQTALAQNGLDSYSAAQGANFALTMMIRREALVLGIADACIIGALIIAVSIPLCLFLGKGAVEKERARQLSEYAHLAPPTPQNHGRLSRMKPPAGLSPVPSPVGGPEG